MQAIADAFTEADLLRFFNSLCETEARLREATHPRYVLEIGLIKLIEMRRVVRSRIFSNDFCRSQRSLENAVNEQLKLRDYRRGEPNPAAVGKKNSN